ncbi:hypothetical protein [Neolewinella agarilytica]|uniref:LPS export ABC transporter periplasmic protein LptC n=1 Tax=Neolewinella agarilytica TaxID=478744 RepID=A0A1H9NZJ2_9BACT|nr:hypothetical protein [Neolewinella agarilytica]SER41348.1 hypothetical protein SAMN05444359_14111 [Neolewinella agarilytica]
MRHLAILFLLIPLFFAASCEEEVEPPVDFSADLAYFPLELNQPLYYAVDSLVVFNTVSGIVYDTASAEVRETLVEEFVAGDGTTVYRGERWQRSSPADPWVFLQTYTVSRSQTTAIREEDNLTFTKLVFPIDRGKSWDGNAAFDPTREFVVGGEFLNIYNGWQYRYDTTEAAVTLSTGVTLENTIVVEQAEVDNLIDRRIAFERYAPGIGLVERFIDARATQCRTCCSLDFMLCNDLSWDEKAEKGFLIRQTLLRTE